jgi:hypothetical protein
MSSNDDKIRVLQTTIEKKRKALGDKPKINYVTNGLLNVGDKRLNLNLINTTGQCVSVVTDLLVIKHHTEEANEILGTTEPAAVGDYSVDQWIGDVKQRADVILWSQEDRKLKQLDEQLDSWLSEEAQAADALADIAALLKD